MGTLLQAGLSNAAAAAVMALLVTCLTRLLARRPAILHGLWLLVLVKLITPPLFELPIPWPGPSPVAEPARTEWIIAESAPDTEIVADGAAPELVLDAVPWDRGNVEPLDPSPSTAIPLSFAGSVRWIIAAWLVGSASVLMVSFRRIHRFRRRLTDARRASWLEQEWVDDWARRLGLRRGPSLLWVPGRISPMIWFIGPRPRLILPEELWKRLDGQQRATLLAHELAHLRRGDHYVRVLELLATALFWWHPLVWWMRGPLRDVEEQCCDAWVVWALPDAVRSYAETLLDTLEFLEKSGRPEPLLASGLGTVPHLRRRLTMIMTGSSRRLPGLAGKLGLLTVAGAMLPIGATWAQKADEPKEIAIVVRDDEDDAGAPVAREMRFATVDDIGGSRTPDTDAVVVRLEARGEPTTVVEAGSIDEVVKKLLGQIAVLKKADELSETTKKRIEALTRAVEELKKAAGGPHRVIIRSDGGGRGKITTSRPPAENAADIKKLGAEVAALRQTLEANLKEIEAIQARIRSLGGDPGDVPSVRWTRRATGSDGRALAYIVGTDRFAQTYTIAKPVAVKPVQVQVKEIRIAKPATTAVKPASPAKVESDKPSETTKSILRFRLQPDKPDAAEAVDVSKLEALEKKLRALQVEVDRLKKAARDHGAE